MSAPIPRVGGRLLLVSPAGRLLLIHERLEDESTHWLTPGGGVEGDEPAALAAVRETFEETGLRAALPGDARSVLTTRRTWNWGETVYDQTDHFFLWRTEEFDPQPASLTDVEQLTLLGHHWWSLAELRASDAVFVPGDVADVLDRVLSEVTSERS